MFDPKGKKEKSGNFFAHLQDMPNQILDYGLAIT